jgi:hypothetical protein
MGFGRSADQWVQEAKLNLAALELCYDQIYPVARIVCVFESMRAQQKCLRNLMAGSLAVRCNWDTGLPEAAKFRGVQTLEVQQAEEPSDYCYANFQKVHAVTLALQQVMMYLLVLAMLALSYLLILVMRYVGPVTAAVGISVLAKLGPELIREAIDQAERHELYSLRQLSIMNKVVVYIAGTTAILIFFAQDKSKLLGEHFIEQIAYIIFANNFILPLYSWLRPLTHFRRWLHARHAANRMKMKSFFGSMQVDLGEQQASINASVFVSVFWFALVPSGLLMTGCGFIFRFWVEKHQLLRSWHRMPEVGTELVAGSMWHLLLTAIAAFFVSSRIFAGWPFDDVCFDGGNLNATPYSCNRVDKLDEPILSTQPWMNKDQVMLYQSNQAIMLFLLLMGLGAFVFQTCFKASSMLGIPHHDHDSDDDDDDDREVHARSGRDMPYTMVDEVQAYIPLIHYGGMETPLVCCDVRAFDEEYLPFAGDHSAYSLHSEAIIDLTEKYAHEHRARDIVKANLFSTVTVFPTAANPDPMEKVDFGDRGYGWMWVHVERARDLKAADWNGSSDPRVDLEYDGAHWHTEVEMHTCNPEWQQQFKVPILNTAGALQVNVFDYDVGKSDDFLGQVQLSMEKDLLMQCSLHQDNRWEHEFKLLGRNNHDGDDNCGFITLMFLWEPNKKYDRWRTGCSKDAEKVLPAVLLPSQDKPAPPRSSLRPSEGEMESVHCSSTGVRWTDQPLDQPTQPATLQPATLQPSTLTPPSTKRSSASSRSAPAGRGVSEVAQAASTVSPMHQNRSLGALTGGPSMGGQSVGGPSARVELDSATMRLQTNDKGEGLKFFV